MSDRVRGFYEDNAQLEWERLEQPAYRLELLTTLPLVERHFPRRARVADIGGGPGRYTVELAQRGDRVTLVDLSDAQVALARTKLEERGLAAEALLCGDARDLSRLETASFNAALVLGPLYHLRERADRDRVLAEVSRILAPGGVAIVAWLNAWGVLRVGLTDFPSRFRDLDFVRGMLGEGAFPGEALGFTEAFLTTPPQADAELRAAGFEVLDWIGCEGFAGGMHEALEALSRTDREAYEGALKLAVELAGSSPFRETAEHLHYVVRKR